ncbi:MAG: hypothetical protein CMJ64_20910 [Planctomycetaceae bacterium]|nr:hypothetical protein [Planctomycetaceae bacterium]
MSKKRSLFGAFTLVAVILCSAARSAELRTTSGERTIYRTAVLDRSDGVAEGALVSHNELLGGELVATLCPSCGVAGCDRACISLTNWYANAEYLLWWRRGMDTPPLVTTSPPGTAQAAAGVLPGATVLFGGDRFGDEARPGGRLTLGKWLDDYQTCGVEGRFWMLGSSLVNFSANSTDFPILARPFRDPNTLTNQATLLAFPGFTGPGNAAVTSESDVLGGDAYYRWLVMDTGSTRFDFLAGYQFARIDEVLNINSFSTAISVPTIGPGTTFTIAESFTTRNEFHGGQIGLSANYENCNWRLDLLAKIAFGNMRQAVSIAGQTTIVTPGPGSTTNVQNGPLAGGNVGRFTLNEFVVAPELGAKFRYSVHECLDLTAGYSFIYWSDVAQPGDQIDPLLNDPPSAFVFNSDSYWVHGVNFGAEVRF